MSAKIFLALLSVLVVCALVNACDKCGNPNHRPLDEVKNVQKRMVMQDSADSDVQSFGSKWFKLNPPNGFLGSTKDLDLKREKRDLKTKVKKLIGKLKGLNPFGKKSTAAAQ